MTITVSPVTQSFAAEIGDVDFVGADRVARPASDQGRVRQIRGADLPRPAAVAGPASQLATGVRTARDHDRAASQGRQAARAQGIRRRFQPRPGKPGVGQGFPAAHVPNGQPAVAHQLFRSSGCRRWRRCSMRARSRRSAATRNSPTSGRPMTRCPKRRSAASTTW